MGLGAGARLALATNAFPPLVRRVRPYVVPVWDYVLMTEPLSAGAASRDRLENRQGIGDAGNQFHYYRQTADGRILWGGYDAVYYFGNGMDPGHEHNAETYATVAAHFFETFPQLDGLRFTHRWGGAIDTCTRFTAFWGTAHRGRVAYAARLHRARRRRHRGSVRGCMLDLLDGRDTELHPARHGAQPSRCRSRPSRSRSPASNLTRWSLDRADSRRRPAQPLAAYPRRLGLGFDS